MMILFSLKSLSHLSKACMGDYTSELRRGWEGKGSENVEDLVFK